MASVEASRSAWPGLAIFWLRGLCYEKRGGISVLLEPWACTHTLGRYVKGFIALPNMGIIQARQTKRGHVGLCLPLFHASMPPP